MLLLIDNYDSFTYNLVQYFEILGQNVLVRAHDAITLNQIKEISPHYLVLSPGPKAPEQAGISLAVIQEFHRTIPMLGVCLGHQCLAQAFGGTIISASEIMHGQTSTIVHNGQGIFKNIPNYFTATRYHSLAVDSRSLPPCLRIDAWVNETIMAISHRKYPLFGLQFHPEAILSEHGLSLLENFLQHETQSTI